MKYLILLLLPLFIQAQYIEEKDIFATTDSIPNITTPDTVQWRLTGPDGKVPTAWNDHSATITATNKTSEETVIINFADETAWTYGTTLDIRIKNGSATYDAKKNFFIGNLNGAVTMWVVCDTTENGANDYVTYSESSLGGN